MMTIDEIMRRRGRLRGAWSRVADACTYLDITVTTSTDATPRATNDGQQQHHLPRPELVQADRDGQLRPRPCAYDPAALALTSVSASTSSGDHPRRRHRGQRLPLQLGGSGRASRPARQRAAGPRSPERADPRDGAPHRARPHLLLPGRRPRVDNTGNPIPDCASASAEVLATTMFPSANPGDIDKRTLAPDDQQAVCEIYPAAQDPMTCSPPAAPPEEGAACSSCAVGGAPASAAGTSSGWPRRRCSRRARRGGAAADAGAPHGRHRAPVAADRGGVCVDRRHRGVGLRAQEDRRRHRRVLAGELHPRSPST